VKQDTRRRSEVRAKMKMNEFGREVEVEVSLTAQVGRLAMIHYDPSAEHGGGHTTGRNQRSWWRETCLFQLTVLECHGGHGGPRCSEEEKGKVDKSGQEWT
jgi:hypothetical protein